MEDLNKALEYENERFWNTRDYNNTNNSALVIAFAIRWAAIVIAKEIREKNAG